MDKILWCDYSREILSILSPATILIIIIIIIVIIIIIIYYYYYYYRDIIIIEILALSKSTGFMKMKRSEHTTLASQK